jgi:uncharacterized protein (TIGR02246 family)
MAASLLAVGACGESPQVADAPFADTLSVHLAAVSGRDLAAFAPTLAEDVVVIFPNGGRLEGKQAVLDFHREWFADNQWIYEAEVVRVEEGTDQASALVRYSYRDDAEASPSLAWLVLEFRRTDVAWQLYHDQNTAIAPTRG